MDIKNKMSVGKKKVFTLIKTALRKKKMRRISNGQGDESQHAISRCQPPKMQRLSKKSEIKIWMNRVYKNLVLAKVAV